MTADDRPSIGELQTQRDAMTGGRWEVDIDRDQQANIFAGDEDRSNEVDRLIAALAKVRP